MLPKQGEPNKSQWFSQDEIIDLKQMVSVQKDQIHALAGELSKQARRWRIMRNLIVGLFVLAILGLSLSGSVSAQSSDVITACYSTKDGALRLIDPAAGQTCDTKENQITWNQVGPQGPPGISGYHIVRAYSNYDLTTYKSAIAVCPSGEVVLGGGASIYTNKYDPNWQTAPVALKTSIPFASTNGIYDSWEAIASITAPYNQDWALDVTAVCGIMGQ